MCEGAAGGHRAGPGLCVFSGLPGDPEGAQLSWPHRPRPRHEQDLPPGGRGPCCSRRGACLSALLLLLLATLAALVTLVISLGLPARTPGAQACVTPTNRTGFLCHDWRSCIPASGVCDGLRTCPHGEDEDESLCRDAPHSLPSFLVARCGDPASWIYSDQKCDGTNNCGDCSDELSPVTACPPCGPGWWRCSSTFFQYCGCVPRTLCQDGMQHCSDWSDEYSCLRS
ncbi:low-density lipoprotein receptor class A domain-containing protein 1 [Octodon degus]|uniref:Low-density lipoprotein receptor class A domain-containing protein 1 n=1 Tax=Octodon degus TaxID=10160 RepID=A0A6P6DFR3_OCTDE|nr:low-density lipoprotein receptor class A domain-containing protein 1 [Octodon degus]